MELRRRARLVGAAGVLVAGATGCLVACGDPVTGPHDWNASGYATTTYGASNGVGTTTKSLRGALLNRSGVPAPNTSFAEQCFSAAAGYITPTECTLVVNTGTLVYVARLAEPQPGSFFGTFKTLDGSGTLRVSQIPVMYRGPGPAPVFVLVTARTRN
jgi:hypothetical protein